MTFIEKQHKNDLYYINVAVEGGLYIVSVYPRYGDGDCGYPVKRMTYSLADKKQAYATFNRYVKKYTV